MSARVREEPIVMECSGERMIGILTMPDVQVGPAVLIVVGGPQYRVGSHRQFTLLARSLGRAGVASLRFDVRGMGDSEGAIRSFEHIAPDLRAAMDCLAAAVPSPAGIVLWGLCDAASAALLYAYTDQRVTGLVLLNPWVRTDEGEARVLLKNYYLGRLIDPGLWRQILRGELQWRRALSGVLGSARAALPRISAATAEMQEANQDVTSLPDRMAEGLTRFRGKVLFVLSGKDLTAQEFEDLVKRSPRWRSLLVGSRVSQRKIAEANHTFSTLEWRQNIERWTLEWVESRGTESMEREHG